MRGPSEMFTHPMHSWEGRKLGVVMGVALRGWGLTLGLDMYLSNLVFREGK